MEINDLQDYADIALTKFYNPAEDIGLNYEWLRVVKIFNEELSLDGDRFVFGQQICSTSYCFNPGRIGSYFQSFDDTQRNLNIIRECLKHKSELAILEMVTILQQAVDTQ